MGDKMFGWAGTVLRVDLNREKVVKQPLDKKTAADFIGGRGLNSKTLFDEAKPGIDPLVTDLIRLPSPRNDELVLNDLDLDRRRVRSGFERTPGRHHRGMSVAK
jgi:hypothetical protein